jgi:transposase-like protein
MLEVTMINKYTEQERIQHVKKCQKWRSRGYSIKFYAIKHEILPRTLQNWVKKYHNESEGETEANRGAELVKIPLTKTDLPFQSQRTSSMKVTMGLIQVELPEGNSDADLKRVLSTLKEMI